MKFREKEKICVDILVVSFTNFKGIQGYHTKFQAISRVQGAKINSRPFKGLRSRGNPVEVWGENNKEAHLTLKSGYALLHLFMLFQ